MLQNTKVTAFTVSELLRENQQGDKIISSPPPQIRVKEVFSDNIDVFFVSGTN